MKAELYLLGRRFDMAPRDKRRKLVVVIYSAIFVSLAASWLVDHWQISVGLVLFCVFLANRFVFGGYGSEPRAMIKPFLGNEVRSRYLSNPDSRWSRLSRLTIPNVTNENLFCSDEREVQRRDEAHQLAYRCLGVTVTFTFLVAYLAMIAARLLKVAGIASAANAIIHSLLMVAFVVFVTLPQAILLWTEPDLEPESSSLESISGAAQ